MKVVLILAVTKLARYIALTSIVWRLQALILGLGELSTVYLGVNASSAFDFVMKVFIWRKFKLLKLMFRFISIFSLNSFTYSYGYSKRQIITSFFVTILPHSQRCYQLYDLLLI